jgi:hypothetical protein
MSKRCAWLIVVLVFLLMAAPFARAQSILGKGVSPVADAIAGGYRISFSSTGTPLISATRAYVAGGTAGTVAVAETGALVTSAGPAALSIARVVTSVALADAVMVGAAGYQGWIIGTAIASALGLGDPNGGSRIAPTGSGWFFDPGAVPTGGGSMQQGMFHCTSDSVGSCVATAQYSDGLAACTAALSGVAVPSGTSGWICAGSGTYIGTTPNRTFSIPLRAYFTSDPGHTCASNCLQGSFAAAESLQTVQGAGTCAPYIDALNPAFSNSSPVPGSDGKCPTGRYTVAVTPQQMVDQFNATTPERLRAATQDAVESKGVKVSASGATVSGPASVTGTPTTNTTSDPSGTTTTTTTPRLDLSYAGDQVKAVPTTTAVTTKPDGTTSTTTETKPDETDKPKSLCEEFPDISACAKLDTPTGDQTPTRDQAVTVAPDSGWGASSGTCPGVVHLAHFDVDPFGLLCTYMNGIRSLVIGFAGIMGCMIFLGRLD